MGNLPPSSSEMQVFDNHNYADKQHGLYLIDAGPGNVPFHSINIQDHTLWRSLEPTWHMGNPITDQHMTSQFGYSREQEPGQLLAGSSINDFLRTTRSHIPPEEWPIAPTFNITCGRYDTPAAPALPTLRLSIPQNPVAASPEFSVHVDGREGGESSPPMPQSSENTPTIRKKRIRNRLAAARCRKKAKQDVDELQQRERDLLREYKKLGAELCLLREELVSLKSEILRHSACANEYIRNYIQRAIEEQHVNVQSEDSSWGFPNIQAPS
ncbi:hypothetical protein F5Y14DRAFT_413852 [Nemania sp. NC0429]|nr:hypothetical protein F5Y14DRAFT_413852 [Nemania sp. NC0429]